VFGGRTGLSAPVPQVAATIEGLETGLGSGVSEGGDLAIGVPNTTFSIADGFGFIVDSFTVPDEPTITRVEWSGLTNIPVTAIGAQLVTFVSIDSAGTVLQQGTRWTQDQYRDEIIIGAILHPDLATVTGVADEQHPAADATGQTSDIMHALGILNVNGNVYSPNAAANLTFDKSAGEMLSEGANYPTDPKNPHIVSLAQLLALTFTYRFQTGVAGATGTDIDPDIWDNGGVSTAVPNNRWTVQRIYSFSDNSVEVQPGEFLYTSNDAAQDAIPSEAFVTEPLAANEGLLRGFLIVQEGATDLTDDTTAVFLAANKFGGTTGAASVGLGAGLYTTVVTNDAELQDALENDRGDTFITDGHYTIDTDVVGPLNTTPRRFVGAGRQLQSTGPFSGPGVIIEFIGAGTSITGLDFSAGLTDSEGVEWSDVSMFSSTASVIAFVTGLYSAKNINLNGGSVTIIGFADSLNLVNCSAVNLDAPGLGFFGCTGLTNCTSGGLTGGDLVTIGFFTSENLVNCRAVYEAGNVGASTGFLSCERLTNCEVEASDVTACTAGLGFDSCVGLTNCRATGPSVGAIAVTKGFDSCTGLTNCVAVRFGANFDLCTFSTNCQSTQGTGSGTDGTHFTASTGLVNCKADGAGDDVGISGFFSCLQLSGCEAINNTDHGFEVCDDLDNCRGTGATNNGFDNSSQATGCTAILNGANGFSRTARISTSRAVSNAGDGFNFCSFLSGCESNTNTVFGYAAGSIQISNCAGAGNLGGLSDLSNLIVDPVTAAGI
jgi:hypothetical protein